jgi:glycosyltransferase involved in cell wall biosynthesis
MIKIVHVIKGLNFAGSGRSLCAITKYLKECGPFHSTVISLLPNSPAKEMAEEAGIRLLLAPEQSEITRELEDADIVQIEWWNNPQIYELFRWNLPPMRLVMFLHVAGDTSPNILLKEVVDFADLCVAGCPYTYDRPVIQNLPIEIQAKKAAVIYSTFDVDRLSDAARKPHQGFNVGYIGTADFKKMYPNFVPMSSRIRAPGIRFIVCGNGAIELLKQQAERLSVPERFDFRGYVSDIKSVLEILDVYGYPLSDNPGAELNVQEALYVGVPVVVFRLGGLRDVVVNNFTGLVVRSEDEYVEAIEYLYHNPAERQRMGDNAATYARHVFGGKNSAKQFKVIYERMMRLPKRSRSWPGGSNAMAVQSARSGADFYIESLGEKGDPFRISMTSPITDEVLEAGRQIASLNHKALFGVQQYEDYYPDDGFLHLWAGLILGRMGECEKARIEFEQASECGLTHWSLLWYKACLLEKSGRIDDARHACESVLSVAPDLIAARDLLTRLHGRSQTLAD